MNARELRQERATILDEVKALVMGAEAETRDLNETEQKAYDAKLAKADELLKRAERIETLATADAGKGGEARKAPAYNKTRLGDNEDGAVAAYFRSGDMGGFATSQRGVDGIEIRLPRVLAGEKRATDTILNIASDADGAAVVPTGFAGRIAAAKEERMLANRLGVTRVPGVGTTVEYPYESTSLAVLAATSEQVDGYTNTYERDAVQFTVKSFTLAKKTKKIALTEELMNDEDAALMAFIADAVGRAAAKTHNSLLLTEVAANGTALKTFASATVIADTELEPIRYNTALSYYLDDSANGGWVMQSAVLGEIVTLGSTSNRHYMPTPMSNGVNHLLGYPVYFSSQSGATAASTKSVYFGAWDQVGMREDPALSLLRDPYSTDGIVYLKYTLRVVYGVLQPAAVGYGVHPSA